MREVLAGRGWERGGRTGRAALTIWLSFPKQALGGGAPSPQLPSTASSPDPALLASGTLQPPGLFPLWSQPSVQPPVQLLAVVPGGGSGQRADP